MAKRILIAKPGLDGNDRGAKIVALTLRDAGFEVIYTGLHQTPQQIVKTAIQEDVDAIGLSSLSGSYAVLIPKVMELLKNEKVDIPVIAGGVILQKDVAKLKEAGVKEVFGVGTPMSKITEYFKRLLSK